jgi:hypothetical protein
VVPLVAELRAHERQAAEELGQWKAGELGWPRIETDAQFGPSLAAILPSVMGREGCG